jgi:uncharacterized protein with NAD-binding domain and iron-sulfur cluster
LGGGLGACTAAYWLTSFDGRQNEYEITLYQSGWRLGGKGAYLTGIRIHRLDAADSAAGQSERWESMVLPTYSSTTGSVEVARELAFQVDFDSLVELGTLIWQAP